MNELRNYVDSLFAHYRETKQIKELKEEILGNLEARKVDLIALGTSEAEAIAQAEQSITSIDGLIDGNKEIYRNQFWKEWLQWVLIYLINACIVSIPMRMVHIGTSLSTLLFFAAILVGAIYIRSNSQAYSRKLNKKAYVNLGHIERIRNIIWFFWGVFTLVYSAATTALYFGSNIWFSRSISINGPYELAVIVIFYAVPFFTVIIPLSANKMPGLVLKYEVQNNEETE